MKQPQERREPDPMGGDPLLRAEPELAPESALGPESAGLRALVADLERSIEERLEAFEDIVDTEVGDTELLRARNLERSLGVRQLFVKFEGGNPSGTQKDRIAFAQVGDAIRRGFEGLSVASCGNYGVAAAIAGRLAGLRVRVLVPEGYHARRLSAMAARGEVEILRHPGDYESAVAASGELAEREGLYDANPGGANTALQLKAYGEIAFEIYDELRDAPAAVAVPVSNGTTLAGIHRGFVSLYRRGRTSRIPRVIAASSWRKNPIVEAFRRGLATCDDLPPASIRQTEINEPLINWHSIDGDLALEALRASAGFGAAASDRALSNMARLVREQQGLDVLPASTAGLVALGELALNSPLPPDRYVAVVTGRRS